MEAKFVALNQSSKDMFPIVDVVNDLHSAVSILNNDVVNMHIKVHEDNAGAPTLAKLEPWYMTPDS